MARNTIQGQSYPMLDRVTDEGTRYVIRMLMDQINLLRQPANTQDLGGNIIINSGTPTESTALVPKSYVDNSITNVRTNLSGSGSTPLDVTALRGQLSQVQRAKLRVNPTGMPLPTNGQPFELLYDIDTAKEYYWDSSTSTWFPINKGLLKPTVTLYSQGGSLGPSVLPTILVAGFYRISAYYRIEVEAGINSSIFAVIEWIEHGGTVSVYTAPFDTNIPGADIRNLVDSAGGCSIFTWIDAGTTPVYVTSYVSNPPNELKYTLLIGIEQL
jgi:hypothetical protein